MNKHLIILSLFPLLFFTGCASCSTEKKEKEEGKFLVTSPIEKDTITTREYVCQIHAIQHIELRALEKGYLTEILVDEGQFIKKGKTMFQIMPILYEAELKKAEAEAEFAEIEYKNTKTLADSNVVSGNQLALAKAKFDKAKAELLLAKAHLGFTTIKAPFNGIMNRFHVRKGSLLNEGDLLTTLSDNSKMWVYFNVPEAEYLNYKSRIKKNKIIKVRLRMANQRVFDHSGWVETIEADFNNETGNIAFRATFPNPNGLLRHGETGNIVVDEPLKNALLIPQKATFEVLDKKYVFVVTENENHKRRRKDGDENGGYGVIRAKEITIGAEIPHLYAVKQGLSKKDKILLEGLRLVKEGDKIKYDFLQPGDVISHLELYAE